MSARRPPAIWPRRNGNLGGVRGASTRRRRAPGPAGAGSSPQRLGRRPQTHHAALAAARCAAATCSRIERDRLRHRASRASPTAAGARAGFDSAARSSKRRSRRADEFLATATRFRQPGGSARWRPTRLTDFFSEPHNARRSTSCSATSRSPVEPPRPGLAVTGKTVVFTGTLTGSRATRPRPRPNGRRQGRGLRLEEDRLRGCRRRCRLQARQGAGARRHRPHRGRMARADRQGG